MAALMSGPSLLLATLVLLASACADSVTTQPCEDHCTAHRLRQYPTDNDASSLCLSRCDKTELTPQDLAGIPNVNSIDLSFNNITIINKDVFSAVPKLKWLQLRSNQLHELPVFKEHSCDSLTDLFLDKNLITGISNANTFAACLKIQGLSLPSNRIEYLHPDVFKPLTDLRRLYLQDNRIRYISEQIFAANSKLDSLELQENKLTYLPANFVSNLKRVGISLEIFYFSDNPWQCSCLLELLEEVKSVGVSDYSAGWDYDGTRRECETNNTGAVLCDRQTSLTPRPAIEGDTN